MIEAWRDVVGYVGLYEVSNLGRVRRSLKDRPHDGTFPGRILRPHTNHGYFKLKLRKNGDAKILFVHRLVAEAFLSPAANPDQRFVNHIDACRINNAVSNLEWCTRKENTRHAAQLGRMPRGADNYNTKLTADQVQDIRSQYRLTRIYQVQLAAAYGVSQSAISKIIRFENWAYA